MKFRTAAFNIYLGASIGASVIGCQSPEAHHPITKYSTLRLHLEVARDGTERNEPVPIFRESPVWVNVDKAPFLTEADVVEAKVMEDLGGFSIQVRFTRRGRMLLENFSATNNQKHYAIFSEFPEPRWLGAPVFTKRIADGIITFVPDATRAEADRIVSGLNDVAKDVRKQIGKGWPTEE